MNKWESFEKWECYNIYTTSLDQLNEVYYELVKLMITLKKNSHLETWFFNRYADGQFLIKLGMVNSDDFVNSELNILFNKYGIVDDIEPYDCELWEVEGTPIDFLKCISCELFETIINNFKKPLTRKQMGYVLHFLMNQLGLGYDWERSLYHHMEKVIEQELEKRNKEKEKREEES